MRGDRENRLVFQMFVRDVVTGCAKMRVRYFSLTILMVSEVQNNVYNHVFVYKIHGSVRRVV